jgi:hypothetical protein
VSDQEGVTNFHDLGDRSCASIRHVEVSCLGASCDPTRCQLEWDKEVVWRIEVDRRLGRVIIKTNTDDTAA